MLEQLIEVINHTFNFCKNVSINMELMQLNAAQMAMYSIVVGNPQLTLTLLTNIKMAAKSSYGLKFHAAMHAICKKNTCNHVHNGTALKVTLMEPVGANGVRVLKDAPAPSTGAVHSIAYSISYLHAMMDNDIDLAHTKLMYSIGTDINLLKEERKPLRCNCKESQHSKLGGGLGKKKNKDNKPKKNTCPHCKKFHHRKPHHINPDKCMWIKKYMGNGFKSICNEIQLAFKLCYNFFGRIRWVCGEGGFGEQSTVHGARG
jgi:hypothetical protein